MVGGLLGRKASKKETRGISKEVLGYDLYVNAQHTKIIRVALLIMTINKTKPEGQTINIFTIIYTKLYSSEK